MGVAATLAIADLVRTMAPTVKLTVVECDSTACVSSRFSAMRLFYERKGRVRRKGYEGHHALPDGISAWGFCRNVVQLESLGRALTKAGRSHIAIVSASPWTVMECIANAPLHMQLFKSLRATCLLLNRSAGSRRETAAERRLRGLGDSSIMRAAESGHRVEAADADEGRTRHHSPYSWARPQCRPLLATLKLLSGRRLATSASTLWRGYASTHCTRRCTCSRPKMKRGAKRGSALGVVVEVALLNGVRTMSIRSAVSLLNGTEVRVEMLTTASASAHYGSPLLNTRWSTCSDSCVRTHVDDRAHAGARTVNGSARDGAVRGALTQTRAAARHVPFIPRRGHPAALAARRAEHRVPDSAHRYSEYIGNSNGSRLGSSRHR